MRVLILHPALTPYRVDFFNLLSERVDLHVVFLQENAVSQNFDKFDLISRSKFKHEWLFRGVQLGPFYLRFGLIELIRRIKPDLVITHEFLGVSLQVLLLGQFNIAPAQIIWTATNPTIFSQMSAIRKSVIRFFLKRIKGLIVYTEDMASIYRQQLNYQAPAVILPNIPDALSYRKRLVNSRWEARRWIARFGWDSTKLILFVGRLSREKAVHRLLKALTKLEGLPHKWALVVVGDGLEGQRLKNLVLKEKLSGSVFFVGRQEGKELSALYSIASVFVLTSTYEPFGAVVNEALLSGVPVICTEEVGAKVFIENGVNGAVVSGDIAGELADQINAWLRQGVVSIERVNKLFDSLLPVDLETLVDSLVFELKAIKDDTEQVSTLVGHKD